MTNDTMKTIAHKMIAEGYDWHEVSVSFILGVINGEVWLLDATYTCDMDKMPKITPMIF